MMKRNLLLLLGAVVLAIIPLVMWRSQFDQEIFEGADTLAKEKVHEINPDYEPWYTSFWEPPSGEIESLLFALQAAIGAGLVCYALGYYRGRYLREAESSDDAPG